MVKYTILPTRKSGLRKRFLAIRKELSNESRALLDSALFSNTVTLPEFKNSKALLCYYPIKGEPNIIPLIKYAQSAGKQIAFPISHESERRLSFHVVSDMSELIRGTYGIPEPPESAPELTDFDGVFCLVPALAFSKSGQRLGYGGGYYDRFLSGFNGVSAGLCYSNFFVNKLPTEEHDIALDIIISEKGVFFPHG